MINSTDPVLPEGIVGVAYNQTFTASVRTSHLEESEEIAHVAEINDLSAGEVQDPSFLGAVLLIDRAEDKDELENACLPLFSFLSKQSGRRQRAQGITHRLRRPLPALAVHALLSSIGDRMERCLTWMASKS